MNKIKQAIIFSNADIGYSKTLIEKFSGSLDVGDKVGIVAPNGSGKSCLLQTIFSSTELLSGSLNVHGSLSLISQVLQIPENTKNITIEQFASQKKLSLDQINNFSGEHFQKIFKNISIKDVSGGEFAILQITVSFLTNPDILLIDEPTNHLDFSARKTLLNLLRNFKGSLIFVSHDIWFLDNLANRLWIIENNSIRNFQGTYAGLEKENLLKMEGVERQKESLRKKTHKLHRSIKRENIRHTRSVAEGRRQASDRSMSRGEIGYFANRAAVTTGKKTKKLQNLLEKTQGKLTHIYTSKRKSLRASLTTLSKNKIIYSLDSCSLYVGNSCLIQDIKLSQSLGDRYVIFGKNGSGKSSFAKALMGLEPYRFEPKAKINSSVKIVYFDQQYDAIDPEKTVLANMQVYSSMSTDDTRKHLSRYLFFTQQDVDQKAKYLSGGMLARLACAIVAISPVDLLILDEPTNNLDIDTIQELTYVLSEYKGALLAISHDIDFVKNLEPNKLLFIKNNILKSLSVDDLSEIEDISDLL